MARVLAISSHVVRGHVGLAATVPAMQWLGHEVWALPTVLLASRPGLGRLVRREVPAPDLAAMLSALEADGCWASLDAVLTGYFPSPQTVTAAARAIARIRRANPGTAVLVDPVLGDGGRLYIAEETAEAIQRELLPLATIATPNRFELQWLAGGPTSRLADLTSAARRLGPGTVVVTSAAETPDTVSALLVTAIDAVQRTSPRRPGVPNGAGDLFAGLLLGHLLRGRAPATALDAALADLDRVLAVSANKTVLQLSALVQRGFAAAVAHARRRARRQARGAMIPRYTRPEMARIWAPQTRFRIWFEFEAHAASAMAGLGLIPTAAAEAIWDKGSGAEFDVDRIAAIEREVKHDVIAFLTHLAEHVGPEARFVHLGLTSSDILDTCLNVQLVRAADLLIADLDALLAALKRRAFEHKMTPTIGRSHGIHAEPTTFGLKLAAAYAEFARAKERMGRARSEVATCAVSGAVGTFANVDPRVEAYVAERMGLVPEPVSTQVIPRDRHAVYFATLAVIASSLERLAVEIRHLQRTEVLEAEEFFSEGQKGSSAMPHKRNPVLTENITGLARMVRAYALPALENVALWHERDISHSSVERMISPDATVTLDFALARMTGVIDNLVVYPQNMKKNLDRLGGLVHSQRVLLALVDKGLPREDAYRLVQRNAMRVWHEGGDFLAILKADPDVAKLLSPNELRPLFDLGYHTRHIDAIFARVFGAS